MDTLVVNIKGLAGIEDEPREKVCGSDMSLLGIINDAFLLVSGGVIARFGRMERLHAEGGYRGRKEVRIIEASGKFVFPSFCDPHTHIVHAGSREKEFTDRIKGASYEEIALRGGGILNSARMLHQTTEDELYRQSMERINEITRLGTGAVEIKSGYGLNIADEIKMLRVIRRVKESTPMEVKATFLGAHAVPEEFRDRRERYVDHIINEMLPAVDAEKLADYIDVFCDRGFFTPSDTCRILEAGLERGLLPKIHANQLDFSGGVQTAVKFGALSVDHLERSGDEEIKALAGTVTMPTLLPGSSFFLGLPDAPAREMIDSGLPVALASDFNPGSSPSGNMKLVLSLACIKLRMLPAEAINAATLNSAYAMGISATHGSIAVGKTANLFITSAIPSPEFVPYAFGSNIIETVMLKGNIIK